MQPFEQFIIHWWEIKDKETVEFSYSFDNDEYFVEQLVFPWAEVTKDSCGIYLDSLTVALWISYYKLYPTKEILVEHMMFDKGQTDFWNTFYIKWLGEFFYVNRLDPTGLAQFTTSVSNYSIDTADLWRKHLLLRWWWKDSTVSYELLKEVWEEISLLTVWRQYPIHLATSAVTWEQHLFVPRTLDIPQLKRLTSYWHYHGHVPVTWIISFISLLVCKLYGFWTIVTSNEKSADVWNVERHGSIINHQRSKSDEFEQLFSDYIKAYINSSAFYYSRLWDLHEREITKLFSQHKKYFDLFSSCNRNFHQDGRVPWSRRCCICPKCLFVYSILRPFITEEDTQRIRWKELYADSSLIPLMKELLWIEWIKPLECVGTPEEVRKMIELFIEKNEKVAISMPVTKWFIDNVS